MWAVAPPIVPLLGLTVTMLTIAITFRVKEVFDLSISKGRLMVRTNNIQAPEDLRCQETNSRVFFFFFLVDFCDDLDIPEVKDPTGLFPLVAPTKHTETHTPGKFGAGFDGEQTHGLCHFTNSQASRIKKQVKTCL